MVTNSIRCKSLKFGKLLLMCKHRLTAVMLHMGRKARVFLGKSWKKWLVAFAFVFIFAQLFSVMLSSQEILLREKCEAKALEKNHHNGEKASCLPLQIYLNRSAVISPKVTGKFVQTLKDERAKATFILEPSIFNSLAEKCPNTASTVKQNLIFFVKSSILNHDRRTSIRSTWGSVKTIRSTRLEVVFILGTTGNDKQQSKVKEESKVYGDILQMDLLDTPKTVPEKVLAGMQWSSEYLAQDYLYASIDDDVVVHVLNLVDYLEAVLQPVGPTPKNEKYQTLRPCYEDMPLICIYSYQNKDSPSRNPFGKWYVSYNEVPDRTWPTYCRGGLYIMPNKMVIDLFEVSRKTPYLYLDDVWITGFMRRKLASSDCNVIAAPYSQDTDDWFMSLFYSNDHGAKSMVKHLWGNMDYRKVNVESRILEVWDQWKAQVLQKEICAVK